MATSPLNRKKREASLIQLCYKELFVDIVLIQRNMLFGTSIMQNKIVSC